MEFSAAVITRNREKDLEEFFRSVLSQSLLPFEMIVIDDGDLETGFLGEYKGEFERKGISFIYFKKREKGTAFSKNAAFELSKKNIVFVFDDDIMLSEAYFKNVMDVWRENKDGKLMGVAGLVGNCRKKSCPEKIFNKIFLLDSKLSWDVTETVFPVWDDNIKKITKGYYAYGCLCSFDKDLAKNILFRQLSPGRAAFEDVDFFLRAKRAGFHFLIAPKALADHKQSKASRDNDFVIGCKESKARKIIFGETAGKNFSDRISFLWSNTGWVLRQILAGNFSKALGSIRGLF